MIIIESKLDNLEEALSEIFSNTTKAGACTPNFLMRGMAIICLATQERWYRANASQVQKKLQQHIQGRRLAPRLKMRDHDLFINYDTANLAQVYCAECGAWMDLSREELPNRGRFKTVARPFDS